MSLITNREFNNYKLQYSISDQGENEFELENGHVFLKFGLSFEDAVSLKLSQFTSPDVYIDPSKFSKWIPSNYDDLKKFSSEKIEQVAKDFLAIAASEKAVIEKLSKSNESLLEQSKKSVAENAVRKTDCFTRVLFLLGNKKADEKVDAILHEEAQKVYPEILKTIRQNSAMISFIGQVVEKLTSEAERLKEKCAQTTKKKEDEKTNVVTYSYEVLQRMSAAGNSYTPVCHDEPIY